MDYLDEAVEELYNDPAIVASMEAMEEDACEEETVNEDEPQGYGTQEATLFDL